MQIKAGQFYEDDKRIYRVVGEREEPNGTSPRPVVDVEPRQDGQIWEVRSIGRALFERMFNKGELKLLSKPKFIEIVEKQFAQFGFVASPLSKFQIMRCHTSGLTVSQTYDVGCDVYAGWEFTECLEDAKKEG